MVEDLLIYYPEMINLRDKNQHDVTWFAASSNDSHHCIQLLSKMPNSRKAQVALDCIRSFYNKENAVAVARLIRYPHTLNYLPTNLIRLSNILLKTAADIIIKRLKSFDAIYRRRYSNVNVGQKRRALFTIDSLPKKRPRRMNPLNNENHDELDIAVLKGLNEELRLLKKGTKRIQDYWKRAHFMMGKKMNNRTLEKMETIYE